MKAAVDWLPCHFFILNAHYSSIRVSKLLRFFNHAFGVKTTNAFSSFALDYRTVPSATETTNASATHIYQPSHTIERQGQDT